MPDEKTNAPAKPRLVPGYPTPEHKDERTLSERAQDAASERWEALRAQQEARAEQEAGKALGKLSAAYGASPERVMCLPDERGNWISMWWLEPEGFGFQLVRPATRSEHHVNVYAKCDEHGEYMVADNIGPDLADLGDQLAQRDEWQCPSCAPELDEPEQLEQSASEMVGDVILRAVTIAVMGKLEADKQEAQAFVQDES